MTQAIGSFTVAASPSPTTTAFGLTGINSTNYTAYTTGGTAYFPYTVTAVTANGPPAIITVSPAISGGAPAANSYVTVNGALGDTAINGVYQVSAASTTNNVTTISLTGVTGSGTYTANSGQLWTQLTATTTLNPTGWLNGDTICFASTTITYTQCETQTLNGPTSGATLTLPTTLLYTHGGGTTFSIVDGECGDLTRNVKIRGITTAYQAYVLLTATSITNMTWAEFYYMGSNSSNKNGIVINITTGSCIAQYCSLHDFIVTGSFGFYNFSVTITSGTLTLSNNVYYNINTAGVAVFTTSNNTTVSSNLFVYAPGANGAVGIAYLIPNFNMSNSFSFNGNSMAGSANYGCSYRNSNATTGTMGVTLSNNIVHSNASYGFIDYNGDNGILNSWSFWRNTSGGLYLSSGGQASVMSMTSCTFFGNTGANAILSPFVGATFNNCTFNSNSVTNYGVSLMSATNITFIGCLFGQNQTHLLGDIAIGASPTLVQAQLYNCYLYSPTLIYNQTNMLPGAYVSNSKYQQATGSYLKWQPEGTCINDQTIVRSGGYSEQCKPNQTSTGTVAAGTLHSSNQQARVKSGKTYTVACYVRASVSTDAAGAYTGNNPRIILRANYNAGPVSSDTDVADITPNSAVITSSTATVGVSPIDCNTAGAHGLNTGDYVYISGATGDTAMNGNWQVTKTSSTAFTLNSSTSNGTYGASSAKFGQWVYATYTTGTVSDNTVLQFCVGCDGTAGQVNVDWAQNSGDTNWWNGEHQNFLTSNAGSTQ
jgi:hypothetical protein